MSKNDRNIPSQYLVVQHNYFIQSKYQMSLDEQKILFAALIQIGKNDEDFKEYKIDLKTFFELTGKKRSNDRYNRLEEALQKMLKRIIEVRLIDSDGKREYTATALISSARYKEKEGILYVTFHPFLKPYFLQLTQEFAITDIRNIIGLQSTYSIRLYQLIKMWTSKGVCEYKIDHLKEMFCIENEYALYADFKRNVLLKAQTELKKKCDLWFDFEEIKEGRKVYKIKFKIYAQRMERDKEFFPPKYLESSKEENDNNIHQISERELFEESIDQNLLNDVVSLGIGEENAKQLLWNFKERSKTEFLDAVMYTKANIKKAKNPSAYLATALKEGYAVGAYQENQKQAVKKQEQEQRSKDRAKQETEAEETHKQIMELYHRWLDTQTEIIISTWSDAEKQEKARIFRNKHRVFKIEESNFYEKVKSPIFKRTWQDFVVGDSKNQFIKVQKSEGLNLTLVKVHFQERWALEE